MGSFAWSSILSLGMTALRRRIGQQGRRVADTLAGLGLLGFGGLLGWRALRTARAPAARAPQERSRFMSQMRTAMCPTRLTTPVL